MGGGSLKRIQKPKNPKEKGQDQDQGRREEGQESRSGSGMLSRKRGGGSIYIYKYIYIRHRASARERAWSAVRLLVLVLVLPLLPPPLVLVLTLFLWILWFLDSFKGPTHPPYLHGLFFTCMGPLNIFCFSLCIFLFSLAQTAPPPSFQALLDAFGRSWALPGLHFL